jgi:integrase
MTIPKRPRRVRGYSAGEKGVNRVRLFPHPRDGVLFLEYRDEAGTKRRVSLGHTDLARGKQAADAMAAELRQQDGARASELTVRSLLEMYEREVSPSKSESTRKHDRRARLLFEQCWGATTKVRNLDRRDWDRFILIRRSGALRPAGSLHRGGVRDRVIEYDLRLLLAVCNWAETVRHHGRPLLERNPFRGFPVPSEGNPDQPTTTEEEFRSLVQAAREIGGALPLFLLLSHETGHRCTAVGRLRWADVDLRKGAVTWRAEHDKIGMEHTVPLSAEAVDALRRQRRESGTIGDGWVFSSPTDPGEPISRHLLRDWWQRLEAKAKLPRVRGRGWHSLRRKFATDLKHDETPLVDIAYLGGWRGPQTLLRVYMKPDEVTMRGALERRTARRAVGQ